jgi:hypothetical protein
MAIYATNTATQRELIPAGMHVARCYQMIEIGTVTEIVLGNSVTHPKVRIGWELPEERRVFNEEKGEQPFVISKEFTLSMHEKATLRKILESWRGKGFSEDEAKGFDITKLLGVPCMLNIIHKQGKDGTKTYEEITSVVPLPKSMKCPPQENTNFCLSYDRFDQTLFEKLPDFIKDKMKSSIEYTSMQTPNVHDMTNEHQQQEEPDDLPF